MRASPSSVTNVTATQPARYPASDGFWRRVRGLVNSLSSGAGGMRQAIERMNKLIDDARLDYPDQ